MILGAHISTAGGIGKSPEKAQTIGADAIQVFSKNQKQWKAKPLQEQDILLFNENMTKFNIKCSAVHDSYLINLATSDSANQKKSRSAFLDEVIRADLLAIPLLIFHPGSHVGAGEAEGVNLAGLALRETLDNTSGSGVMLLIETTAGQGTSVGYTFQQIRDMIDKGGSGERLGVCYDTAHTFAAGYDIRDRESYQETFESFNRIIGVDRLKAFHLNDSKKEFNSRVDRHDHIGEGYIGREGFKLLLNDPRFKTIPGFLETPGGEKYYKKNLSILRSLN
ncbi:deoxyribonuclease IV [Planctomycetota bacterium]